MTLEEEAEEKLNKAIYSTFHSIEGQKTFKYLLDCYYRVTSLNDEADSNKVLINEGKRFVIIDLLARMELVSKKAED